MESLTGRLLVSPPNLGDPNFDSTVVFVVEHTADGAFGLVLNRPTTVPVPLAVPAFAHLFTDADVVWDGGPVGPDYIWVLGEAQGRAELVDLSTYDPATGPARLRLFAGYAGWASGQLDAEVASGSWIVAQAQSGDAMDTRSDLWRQVLRRQGGSAARWALYPDELSVN